MPLNPPINAKILFKKTGAVPQIEKKKKKEKFLP